MTSVLALTLLAATWTVDDDLAADFPSIAAAIQSPTVTDGDLLRVRDGSYGPFTLNKALTVIGPGPGGTADVSGVSWIVAPGGASITRLALSALRVSNVPGRVRVTECSIGLSPDPGSLVSFRVEGSAEVLVGATDVFGRPAASAAEQPLGMLVASSRVVLAGGRIEGGRGWNCWPSYCGGGDGGTALEVRSGADVLVAGTLSLHGGAAGHGNCGLAACLEDGRAGDGVRVQQSLLRLRALQVGTGPYDPTYGGTPGHAMRASQATVTSSGVTFAGAVDLSGSVHVTPPQVEPALLLNGAPIVGYVVSLVVANAPPSSPVLVLASKRPAVVDVPGWEGPLWIDPAAPFAVVFSGT
ncbi:MAG: hypothetical protein ACF8XB_02815, partial [Planctomycetota bacterium JB042]